jgi:hypothetical protein
LAFDSMTSGVTLLDALVQFEPCRVVRAKGSPPEKKIISPPPWMPALLGFGKGIQDGFAGGGVLMPVLQPLDVHTGVYPSERPPDLGP